MKLWVKTKEFSEGKYLVVRRDGSVPHWPHFVLGARDPASAATLMSYSEHCKVLGFDSEFVASVRELALDFTNYRIEHGDGDPDAPPHRKDDPLVLDAMRGGRVHHMLSIRCDRGEGMMDDSTAVDIQSTAV
jgi:hypothetical protein